MSPKNGETMARAQSLKERVVCCFRNPLRLGPWHTPLAPTNQGVDRPKIGPGGESFSIDGMVKMTDGGSPMQSSNWLESIVKPLSGLGVEKFSPSPPTAARQEQRPATRPVIAELRAEAVQSDVGEEDARQQRMRHFLTSSELAGAPGFGDPKNNVWCENEEAQDVARGPGQHRGLGPADSGGDAGAAWIPAAAPSIAEAYAELEESLKWAEFELACMATRWKDDVEELAFWRHASDKDVAKARAQVKDIAENQRIAKERKEAEQGPRLAKGMPVAAPRDTFEGTPSRLELEVRLGVVLAELSEERERSRVAEKKCEELISEASRNADLNSVGGDERAMAELRNLRRELDQAKEQLGRRNKEAARDGRAIDELSKSCHALQQRLSEANLKASTAESRAAEMEAMSLLSSNVVPVSPALCKKLPSNRSDTPQLARKLPSPAGSHRAAGLASGERMGGALVPPPWAGLNAMRPKDQNWFGDLVSGLQPRQDPGSGRAVAGDGSWFGQALKLGGLGSTTPAPSPMKGPLKATHASPEGGATSESKPSELDKSHEI